MAITRAQQVRQMYKEGSMEPVKQAGVMNYMPSEMVTVPKIAKSSPDTPTAKLAYITPEEQDILIDLNLYGSLDGKPNRGPGGIPSLEGDFGSPTGSTYSGGSAGEDGGSFTGGGGGNQPPSPQLPPGVKSGSSGIVTKEDERRARKETQDFLKSKGLKPGGGNQFNFMDIINPTAKRKAMFNASLMIPGSKANITKMRKAYADYLESMGITPTDELEDTDNLYDFFDKQAFEKGKTINTGVGIDELNQKIYDKLAEDMGPFSNDPLRNQFETLSPEEFMSQNPDLFSKGTPTDVQSYGDFILENFGSPGVKFSGDVGNKEVYVKGYREDGSKIYDVRERRDDGGGDNVMSDYERRLLELEQQLKDQKAAASTTTTDPYAFRFFADGGRAQAMDGGIMNADMIGGMMDGNMDEMGRQMYGLGKLVKKATRGIKKLVKSPIGKAALLYAGGSFLSGKGLFGGLKGTGFLKSEGLKNFFLKDATKKFALDNLSQKGLMTGIAGLSALPFLFQGQEEEEDYDPYRGPDIDIDKIRSDPYGAMGGAYRNYAEGGKAEPVAKKTMPLIDMDGKEKDYRETGGFVDMGRMERADDVPARLSKNEFVFTADAVRNAGEGDIDKGAEVMYNMMKNLEAGGEVSEESQGLEGARKMFQTSQRLEEVL